MKEITVVITSCNRPDLLERTFNSFIKTNTYQIKKYIIIEDSGKIGINDFLKETYKDLDILLIYNEKNIGQLKSIDKAYSYIDTEYIFHCEEDWEFYKPKYIEYSLEILENEPKIFQCWLREDGDTNGHPIETINHNINGVNYRLVTLNYLGVWHGFSFNPTLIRYNDYKIIGPYENFKSEHEIGKYVKDLGYRSAKCDGGFVKHIGWGRHIN